MPDREPSEVKNLSIYGTEALPWSRAREELIAQPAGPDTPYYLSTVRPDGRPHSAGVGVFWIDGDLYFTSGPATRKSKNLAQNPACTIAVHLSSLDLILEGEATRTTDAATLKRTAEMGQEGGWPAEVEGDALTAPFSAPSAGPPPWYLYRFVYHTAFGVATKEPYGATRWRFAT